MKRILLAWVAAVFAVAPAAAQDWAKAKLESSPRHQEWVTVKHDGRTVQCFVVYPEVKDKTSVILVIHEIYGLTDWARDLADQVAAAGYIAIAPDLVSGMAPGGGGSSEFPDEGAVIKAVSGLDPAQVTADLNAAADYAERIPASDGRLIVAGFCWGGTQSFRFATNRSDLKAAFVFYGTAPTSPGELARIRCPVYGFYAGNDARVGATVPGTVARMRQAGKVYEAVTYAGAGHGFMRAGENPAGTPANRKAHDEAWVRWVELLRGRPAAGPLIVPSYLVSYASRGADTTAGSDAWCAPGH